MIDLNELQAAIDRCAFDGDVLGLSKSECTALLFMLREAEKDAARYRWLRDVGQNKYYVDDILGCILRGADGSVDYHMNRSDDE